jgi:hypothetical protein
MHIRDREIERLQKYSESLGLPVSWRKYRRGFAGAIWERDGDNKVSLTMYTWPTQSKTNVILNLLHELSHHLAFIYQGRTLTASVMRAFSKDEYELTEHEREIIYNIEKDDAKYRLTIAYELDIKIPEWRIKADMAVDEWFYYRFWKDGIYPGQQEINDKCKEMKEKYRASKKVST